LLVSLAPTTTRKTFDLVSPFIITTIQISEFATTKSADFFSQDPSVACHKVFPILTPLPFVTNLSPYKCRGVGVPNWLERMLATPFSQLPTHSAVMGKKGTLLVKIKNLCFMSGSHVKFSDHEIFALVGFYTA
jgi:hypothetical protein